MRKKEFLMQNYSWTVLASRKNVGWGKESLKREVESWMALVGKPMAKSKWVGVELISSGIEKRVLPC